MSNSNHKPQASSPAVEVEEFLKTLDTFAEPVAESLPAGPQAPERPALPFQPDEDAGPLNQALERNFAKLLEYHYTAHTSVWESLAPFPEGAFRTSVKGLMSAQLYAFRDADRLRFDYPVLLPENSADHWRLSLREVVDGLLEALADKEEASHLKRALLRVERHIKLLLPKKNGEHLSALWRKAAAAVGKESGKDASKLADELAALGKSLGVDGPLFGFTPDAPTRILGAAGQYDWHRRVAAFASELGDLLNAVSGILAADQAHSPEAHSADTLHAALGKEGSGDFDLDAFSSLLQTGKGGDGLPEARRRRIEQVLKDLKAGQKWFGGHPVMAEIADSCKGALALSRERESTFLAFFKAVHIARLEVANRYDAAGHDAFYQEFDRTALLPEERHLIPPVILSLSPEKLDAAETGALLEILNADLNIKVLLILDDFFGRPDGAKTFWQPGVAGKLASMAMNLNHAFVLQCPGANLDAMTRGFEDGIAFDGPALFAVFQPEAEERTALPAFLRSAAAGESRLMPAFTFHPGISAGLANRLNLAATPQRSALWPESSLTFLNGETEISVSLPYTPVDFLAMDGRFDDHFVAISGQVENERLLPVGEFLARSPETIERALPYVLMVDEDGRMFKVITTRAIIATARQLGESWRHFQELGGINNSFVSAILEEELARLKAEHQAEIEALENNHREEMERSLDQLGKDVVSRIAAGLLSEGPMSMAAMPVAPAAPKPKAAPEPQPAAAPAETAAPEPPAPAAEEEESIVVEDAYIDTPLCTSCNDCISLNSQMFAYDANKQAFVKDASKGTFRQLVEAAEKCPVHIIHPGKPVNPDEPGLEDLIKKAEAYN